MPLLVPLQTLACGLEQIEHPRDLGSVNLIGAAEAFLGVVLGDERIQAGDCGPDGGKLHDNIATVALLLDHALDAANPPLDPAEA